MAFRIIKIVCKLFGIACIMEVVRERLSILAYTFRHALKAQAKKIAKIFLVFCCTALLLALGFLFLLLGLAYWLNIVFSSFYLGFFIVAFFCFLMVIFMILILRSIVNSQAVEQEALTDHL